MSNKIKWGTKVITTALALFVFSCGVVNAVTVGVPTELLGGLPSPEVSQFGRTVLTLFAGYSGVEPSLVNDTLHNLLVDLNDGHIDAIIGVPQQLSEISTNYDIGSKLAQANVQLGSEGNNVCLIPTRENAHILSSFNLSPSHTATCKTATTIEITLTTFYSNRTEQGPIFQQDFEHFVSQNRGSISLIARSQGFEAIREFPKDIVTTYRIVIAAFFILGLAIVGLLVWIIRLRNISRDYKQLIESLRQDLANVSSESTQLRQQLEVLSKETEDLKNQRDQWQQTQRAVEKYMNMLGELLRLMDKVDKLRPEDSSFFEEIVLHVKNILSAEELAMFLFQTRDRKYHLVAGYVDGTEEVVSSADPLFYDVTHSKTIDEKTTDKGRILISSIGSHENALGLLVAKNVDVPSGTRILSALSSFLELLVFSRQARLLNQSIVKYVGLLNSLSANRNAEEFLSNLTSYGFVLVQRDMLPSEGKHVIKTQRMDLLAPDDWPIELDTILVALIDNRED
jgi:FtsZ-binding cell division protein ZapB